jgi:hypothetical protein
MLKRKSPVMRIQTILISITAILGIYSCNSLRKEAVSVSGEQKVWHTITLTVPGPEVDELSWPNPFLEYRLEVLFTQGNDSLRIPGFFAADGNAANSGATAGNAWQVRFTPPKSGLWTYHISFLRGKNLAISDDWESGEPVQGDGLHGSFEVFASDKTGKDFRSEGRLVYDGSRYLKHAGSGRAFLKSGTDSPENFLAYADFDGTPGSHHYAAHEMDWTTGDPVWKDSLGKGIIGALNYLSSVDVNSVYALTLNIMGDGKDVWMYTERDERYRFDCSKLDQWEIVFSHMEKLGIMIHLVTQENENQLLLDNGWTDTQRKVYYRELIARFGHHLALTWNLGEENGYAKWYKLGQTDEQRLQMAEWFEKHDPYRNFTVVHTLPGDPELNDYLVPFLGKNLLDGPSLQIGNPAHCHKQSLKWIRCSAESGRQWVVCIDEIGPWYNGSFPDDFDPLHDTIRRDVLWGNLMAGGAGVEWYMGRKDLTTEDFRPYSGLWRQSALAVQFFREHLPFETMSSMDELTPASGDYCFARAGELYTVYLPFGGTGTIDLRGATGTFEIQWFNPREGGSLLAGSIPRAEGGKCVSFGMPPSDAGKDWIVMLKKNE